MKIISLVENTSALPDIDAEHGLSLYIETENRRILFDMGQTELFADNAVKLGVDLSAVDVAVLSHGHYDHGGGLKKFLEINGKAPVYLHKYAFEPHYNGTEKYIGLDVSLKSSRRLVFTEGTTKIGNGLTLFDCNTNTPSYNLGSFGLNVKENGDFLPDDFRHEHYLLIEEKQKRVLISGCSHKGILNVAHWFDADVIIGGFHFSKLPLDGTLAEYAEELNKHKATFYTCHCTGVEQYEFMKTRMERLCYLSAGQTIEI